jgi:hypothetical protein
MGLPQRGPNEPGCQRHCVSIVARRVATECLPPYWDKLSVRMLASLVVMYVVGSGMVASSPSPRAVAARKTGLELADGRDRSVAFFAAVVAGGQPLVVGAIEALDQLGEGHRLMAGQVTIGLRPVRAAETDRKDCRAEDNANMLGSMKLRPRSRSENNYHE